MPVRIKTIEPNSLAEKLGWLIGDQIIMINDKSIADEIDFRFHSTDELLNVRFRRDGLLKQLSVEKDAYEPMGVELEEFRIRTCGDDCVFCFVDQNPVGLRDTLYFRDGDFRMSFLYGNYITMTNLRQRDMERIVEQRLSPMYISVHCTNDEIRRKMMGHRAQQDHLLGKLRFLQENGIEMHTQIVLVPGFNDGDALKQTIADLYSMNDAVESVSIVPVGLTRHRRELTELKSVTPDEARQLIQQVHQWQDEFYDDIGRGFVYLSDEMYLLAGVDFPQEDKYDGYPLMENGVGMSRDFLNEFGYQQSDFPASLTQTRHLVLATGTLAAPILKNHIAPRLENISGLKVSVIAIENALFGDSVTVSGLLGFKSFFGALVDLPKADLILLPPDCVNFEGSFLDNKPGMNTPEDLADCLQTPVEVFSGDWIDTLALLSDVELAA